MVKSKSIIWEEVSFRKRCMTEGAKRIWEGSEFQRRGPATQNEQPPIARLV